MSIKLFVSFTGDDTPAISRLLSALRKQNLTVWDYTLEGERIAPGDSISEVCRRRIDEAEYFLAFLSSNTFSPQRGRYAQQETRYALQRATSDGSNGLPHLVPVLDLSSPLPNLPDPYIQLSDLLRLEFDGTSQPSADEAVRRFCKETLGIDYVLPIKVDPRIRLIEYFWQEWQDFQVSEERNRLSRSDYFQLDKSMQKFSKEVSQQQPNWEKALITVSAALQLVEDNDVEQFFYFPVVMKGLCQFESGNLEAACRTFELAAQHPRADGNAWAGVALVHWSQHNYAEALSDLQKAAQLYGDSVPWELRFNMICALLAEGCKISLDDQLIEVDPDQLEPEDWVKYKTLKGVYYFQTGRYSKARDELAQVLTRVVDGKSLADENAVIWYSECLCALGQLSAAVRVLMDEAKGRHSGNLYYLAAHLKIELGDLEGSARVFETLCSDPQLVTIKYLVGYARLLKLLGRLDEMRAVCRRALEMVQRLSSYSEEDHFNIGFAHYLLGDYSVADYERGLSGTFRDKSYATL